MLVFLNRFLNGNNKALALPDPLSVSYDSNCVGDNVALFADDSALSFELVDSPVSL